ncbi:MAG: hypothetical protein H6534_03910 [Chthonomonadaceae bacterium]|nr:hypothetical protein [Chthonomonadaceae bacterium]
MKATNIALLAVAAALVGCGQPAKVSPPAPKPVALAAGTPVSLILLQKLDSGGTAVGTVVPLMVAEDVKAPDGTVLIRRGAPASGTVTLSRSAGALSALANTPARLALRLERTWGVDGSEIVLCAEIDDADAAYAFTRDNTGKIGGEVDLEKVWSNDTAQPILERLSQNLEEGKSLDLSDPEIRRTLQDVARDLNLDSTSRLLQRGELERADNLLAQVRQGGSAAALVNGAALPTIGAAIELANLAGRVGSRIGGVFKGRNIRAHVGTPVPALVAEQASVRPQPVSAA